MRATSQGTDPSIRLSELLRSENIADLLSKEELHKIGEDCTRGYGADEKSMKCWMDEAEKAMMLANLRREPKNWPFTRASNVKLPLILQAALQFSARAYPAIINDNKPVKGKVLGAKPEEGQETLEHEEKKDRADRVSAHMSYQLLEEIEEWESDTDRLLLVLSIVGALLRKTYYCPHEGRIVSRLVSAMDVKLNNDCGSFARLPRISEEIELYRWEFEERKRSGMWRDVDVSALMGDEEHSKDGQQYEEDDIGAPLHFVEQHTRIDLDGDGYEEPYIVTYHKSSKEVLRIEPRYSPNTIEFNGRGQVSKITPEVYYSYYEFIPSPEGKTLGVGFGSLMLNLNESANSIVNQLIDAGTLANASGGMVSAQAMPKGERKIDVTKWQMSQLTPDKLANAFVEYPRPRPDATLFALLGFLIDAGKEISATTDIMTGAGSGNIQATTMLAMVEQGTKVFTAIFKRVHRALRAEYKILYRLNAETLPEHKYFEWADTSSAISSQDYLQEGMDISPASDPSMVSDAPEMARGQMMQSFIGDPLVNQVELRRRIFRAFRLDESLIIEPSPPPPDPALAMEAEKMQMESDRIAIDEEKAEAEIALKGAQTLKAIADAEAVEIGSQIEEYKIHAEGLADGLSGVGEFGPDEGAVDPTGSEPIGLESAPVEPLGDFGGLPINSGFS